MFGVIYGCDSCDLQFAAGYNHHSGGICYICLNCGQEMLLHLAKDEFGFDMNDRGRFLQFQGEEMVDAGIEVYPLIDKPIMFSAGKNPIELWAVDCEAYACPSCSRTGGLAAELAVNDPCPKCKTGKIVDNGAAAY
jgi:hypothetical protein